MMRYLFCLILALTLGVKTTMAETQLHVSISDAQDQPIKNVLVHLNKDFLNINAITLQVPDTGFLKYTLANNSAWTISISAPHKQTFKTFLLINDESRIDIAIKLPGFHFRQDLTNLKLVHSKASLEHKKALPLKQFSEGIYGLDIKSDTEVKYKILHAVEGNEAIHGQVQDYFEYDGYESYFSVIKPKDNMVSIRVDTRLYHQNNDILFSKIYPSSVENKAKLMKDLSLAGKHSLKSFADYVRKNGDRAGFTLDESVINGEIKRYYNGEYPEEYKYIAAVGNAFLFKANYEQIDYALKTIPVHSPLWNLYDGYASLMLLTSSTDKYDLVKYMNEIMSRLRKYDDFIQRFAKKSPYHNTKKLFLEQLINLSMSASSYDLSSKYLELYRLHIKDDDSDSYYDKKIVMLNKLQLTMVGANIPEFSFKDLQSSRNFTVDSYMGKYLLLDFWATWCSPCIAEMDVLHTVNEQYKNTNFRILSVSIDELPSVVTEFQNQQWKMPWDNSWITNKEYQEIKSQFNIVGIPKAVLIDPAGKIIAQDEDIRGDKLHQLLTTLLVNN